MSDQFAPESVISLIRNTQATNILSRQPGMSPDVLNEILDRSSQAAKGKITQSTPQLEDLIAQVEQWLSTKDNEKKSYE